MTTTPDTLDAWARELADQAVAAHKITPSEADAWAAAARRDYTTTARQVDALAAVPHPAADDHALDAWATA